MSIRYTERLAEAGIEPSVGSVGDSYDNALAETINGLLQGRGDPPARPVASFEAVEFATLEWVDWFNNRRLARTHRQHPARRGRSALLCPGRGASHGRLTQTKQPPGNPGRFMCICWRTFEMPFAATTQRKRRDRAYEELRLGIFVIWSSP